MLLGSGQSYPFVKLRYTHKTVEHLSVCPKGQQGTGPRPQPQEQHAGHDQGSGVLHNLTFLSLRLFICEMKSLKRLSLRVACSLLPILSGFSPLATLFP